MPQESHGVTKTLPENMETGIELYVCVCVYVFMHVCVHVCVHVCLCMFMCAYMRDVCDRAASLSRPRS